MLILCACGESRERDAGGAVDAGPHPCAPAECGASACGVLDDGCGGTVDCGECVDDAGCRISDDLVLTLPVHPVEVLVTLDGAPLPSVDDPQSAWLHFWSIDTGTTDGLGPALDGLRVPLYEGLSPVGSTVANLPPGDYWVALYNDEERNDPRLPVSGGARPWRVRVVPETMQVEIDLQTALLTIEPRLDGALWNGPSSDRLLVDGEVWSLSREGAALETIEHRVLRGARTIGLIGHVGGWGLPLHTVTIEEDLVVRLDVPTAMVQLDMTRNGAPFARAQQLELVSRRGGHPWLVDAGPGAPPVRMVTGRYGVRYVGPDVFAPSELELTEIEVTADGSVTIDVPTVVASLRFVPGGNATPPDCATAVRLLLDDRPVLTLPSPIATAETPVELVPGTYRVQYEPPYDRACEPPASGWPASLRELGVLQVAADTTELEVAVERWSLTTVVTLDGSSPPTVRIDEGEGSSSPSLALDQDHRLWLYPPGDGDRSPITSHESWVFAGEHELTYSDGFGPFDEVWPRFAQVLQRLDITADTTLAVDIPRVWARVETRLGPMSLPSVSEPFWPMSVGLPSSPALVTSSRAFDRLWDFRAPHVTRTTLWQDDGTARPPIEAWVMPGTYLLELGAPAAFIPAGAHFAAGGIPPAGTPLGCWTVRE